MNLTNTAAANLENIAAQTGIPAADVLSLAKLVALKIEGHGYADKFKAGGDEAGEIMQAAALSVVRDGREFMARYDSDDAFKKAFISDLMRATS